MNIGYDRPLYLLPFDHRHSYVTGMFHATPPLSAQQHDAVTDSKQVIYEAFRAALDPECRPVPPASWSTRNSAPPSSGRRTARIRDGALHREERFG